jgi:alpha-ribazole phosphatase
MSSSATCHVFLRHPPLPQAQGLCYGRLDLPLPSATFDAVAAHLHAQSSATSISSIHTSEIDLRRLPIISSPAQRCLGLARAWHRLNINAQVDKPAPRIDLRLLEMHFGAWEGRTWPSISRDDLDRWAADVVHFLPPDGESFADVIVRVHDLLSELHTPHLIVAHGGVIRAAWHLLGGYRAEIAASMTVAYAEPIVIGMR